MTLDKAWTERRGVDRVARPVGWRNCLLGLALAAGLAAPSLGQTASRSAADDTAAADAAPANTERIRAAALERLSDRVAEMEAESARLREAIRRIEAGDDLREAMASIRPEGREDDRAGAMRERRGPGGPGGPGQFDRPNDRDGGPFHRGPGAPKVTEEQVEQAREYLRTDLPDVAATLERLRANRPGLADAAEKDLARRLVDLGELAQEDPVRFQTESMVMRAELVLRAAVMDYMRARFDGVDAAALEGARERIVAAVADRTAAWVQEREQELVRMGERLTQARLELDQAKEDPSAIIARRVDELLSRLDRIPDRDNAEGGQMRRRDRRPADVAPPRID